MVGASFTVAAVAQVLRSKKSVIASGSAQIDTAQSKFGGSSGLFTVSTGDLLTIQNVTELNLGTGDFTVEGWFRPQSAGTQGAGTRFWYSKGVNTTGGMALGVTTDGIRMRNSGQTDLTHSTTLSTSTWYHIAFTRSGTTRRIWLDGVQVANDTLSFDLTDTSNIILGSILGNNSFSYNGWIDEVRISNSVRYTTTFTPSTSAFVNDANTLLLIHANGTDGSTFFEDDNGVRAQRAIQAVGNAQISTAQSKFGGSSMLFDGSGDSFVVDHSGQMRFGTGDFTMEFWYRPISKFQNFPVILGNRNGFSSGAIIFQDRHDANNTKLSVYIYNLSTSVPQFISTTTTANNTWYHIALSRSGTSLRLFVNGTQEGATVTTSADIDTGAGSEFYYIGFAGASADYNGYTDEVRVSNTARYTANFTAPTEPFVNDSNTLLLVHADGTNASTVVRDDNGAVAVRQPKYITAFGNAQIDAGQYKFGEVSAQFDGTTDYLDTNTTNEFAFGTGQYTIEGWIRLNSTGKQHSFFDIRSAGSNDFILYVSSSNKLEIYNGSAGTGTTNLTTGVWYHVAVVRDSTNVKVYLNGTQETSVSASNMTGDRRLRIGGGRDGAGAPNTDLNGWMDEIRVSNIARYTATFTPSTTPFTNDANTLLLIHADGVDATTQFYDDTGSRMQKGISAIGNAQLDTAQSKFGGSSFLGDGSGDYLQIGTYGDLNLGGDFTIECWYRIPGSVPAILPFYNTDHLVYLTTGAVSGGRYALFAAGSNRFLGGDVTVSANTWYHMAMVRVGATVRVYHNGVDTGNPGSWGPTIGNTTPTIGSYTSYFLNGWIDEYRISNTARYTANFTPSTTPFQNDANTLLLLHMDGTDASTAFFDDNGIAPYTP